ncbi:hypothetical protein VP01_748g2 [Puccinia sorghi]|uniref:Uncharacterized protein n=1 Tax=Puccinia sorghi TaxID=27349 RepID=A0A0L6UCB8_9BASI|nr:hypothetical protein VP01_748g2 [Puccinia sorghi]
MTPSFDQTLGVLFPRPKIKVKIKIIKKTNSMPKPPGEGSQFFFFLFFSGGESGPGVAMCACRCCAEICPALGMAFFSGAENGHVRPRRGCLTTSHLQPGVLAPGYSSYLLETISGYHESRVGACQARAGPKLGRRVFLLRYEWQAAVNYLALPGVVFPVGTIIVASTRHLKDFLFIINRMVVSETCGSTCSHFYFCFSTRSSNQSRGLYWPVAVRTTNNVQVLSFQSSPESCWAKLPVDKFMLHQISIYVIKHIYSGSGSGNSQNSTVPDALVSPASSSEPIDQLSSFMYLGTTSPCQSASVGEHSLLETVSTIQDALDMCWCQDAYISSTVCSQTVKRRFSMSPTSYQPMNLSEHNEYTIVLHSRWVKASAQSAIASGSHWMNLSLPKLYVSKRDGLRNGVCSFLFLVTQVSSEGSKNAGINPIRKNPFAHPRVLFFFLEESACSCTTFVCRLMPIMKRRCTVHSYYGVHPNLYITFVEELDRAPRITNFAACVMIIPGHGGVYFILEELNLPKEHNPFSCFTAAPRLLCLLLHTYSLQLGLSGKKEIFNSVYTTMHQLPDRRADHLTLTKPCVNPIISCWCRPMGRWLYNNTSQRVARPIRWRAEPGVNSSTAPVFIDHIVRSLQPLWIINHFKQKIKIKIRTTSYRSEISFLSRLLYYCPGGFTTPSIYISSNLAFCPPSVLSPVTISFETASFQRENVPTSCFLFPASYHTGIVRNLEGVPVWCIALMPSEGLDMITYELVSSLAWVCLIFFLILQMNGEWYNWGMQPEMVTLDFPSALSSPLPPLLCTIFSVNLIEGLIDHKYLHILAFAVRD